MARQQSQQNQTQQIFDDKYYPTGQWFGRSRSDQHSFGAFLRAARHSEQGRAHLDRHHKGWGKQVAGG